MFAVMLPSWDLKTFIGVAPLLVLLFMIAEFHWDGRAVRQPMDFRPGARYPAKAYAPGHCPSVSPSVGGLLSKTCVEANEIDAWKYGLVNRPLRQGRRGGVRFRWARIGDNAVLSYCGLWGGCRVTAIVSDRFLDRRT